MLWTFPFCFTYIARTSEDSAYASVGKHCAFIGLPRRDAVYCIGAAKKNRAAQPPEGPDAAVN
jgi:hypothetical protein